MPYNKFIMTKKDSELIDDSNAIIITRHYHTIITGNYNFIVIFGKAARVMGWDNDIILCNEEPVLFLEGAQNTFPVEEERFLTLEEMQEIF